MILPTDTGAEVYDQAMYLFNNLVNDNEKPAHTLVSVEPSHTILSSKYNDKLFNNIEMLDIVAVIYEIRHPRAADEAPIVVGTYTTSNGVTKSYIPR